MLNDTEHWKSWFGIVIASIILLACCSIPGYADSLNEPLVAESNASGITDEDIAFSLSGIDDDIVLGGFDTILSFSGGDRYETNALLAQSGWESSEYAILTTGQNWADALAASGLAGALDCPILMTKPDELPDTIHDTIKSLGIQKVIILGGYGAVSENVETELTDILDVNVETRLSGSTRYDTQIAIFEYGLKHHLWESGELIVACGAEGCFADALSVSPVAYSQTMPIFLTDAKGSLSSKQKQVLVDAAEEGLFTSAVLLGGEIRVSSATEGYLWAVVQISCGESKASERFAGANRWDTSALIAEWAIAEGYLEADGVGFASGASPYDALGGGAMQGELGSVMLLVGDGSCDQALSVLPGDSGLSNMRFFGGTGAISQESRDYIVEALGMGMLDVNSCEYGISLDYAVTVEEENGGHGYDSILEKMNPSSYPVEEAGFYQYAILSDGFSGVATAETVDEYLDWIAAVHQESYWGVTSTLRGTGAYFVSAAEKYGINEIYLLSHAGIESAWGCSPLSRGTYYDGECFYLEEEDFETGETVVTEYECPGYEPGVYYNYFGIGTSEGDSFENGIRQAIIEGWNSPQAAIEGGAEWISDNYINPVISTMEVSGQQNTLYKMRWDIARIETMGKCDHQYAESITWAEGISISMAVFYDRNEIGILDTGLRFEIPSYLNE